MKALLLLVSTRWLAGDKRELHARQCHRRGRNGRRHAHPPNFGARTARKQRRPLLDYSGNVVGVVESKLNAITIATLTNDMAQNLNFAIKANVVTNFLDGNSVAYTSGLLASTVLQTSEIAERAKSFTAMIECDK